MRVGKLIVGALSLTLVPGCSEPTPRETVRLEFPDPMECLMEYSDGTDGDYSDEVEALAAAIDRGEPEAMLCSLAMDNGRDKPYANLGMLYRYYRATGREPERLNSYLVDFDRESLASQLRIYHRFSPELTMFDTDFFGCRTYDPVATDLLMRVEPGEDMRCLPPRQLWRDLWHFWGPRD